MPLGFLSSGLTIAYPALQLKRGAFQWQELYEKIGRIGPQNASILDTLEGKIEEG
jgi:hypothetical protein